MEEREQLVFYPSVEEDSFEYETQNMYLALCLTCCWKPSLFKSLIWLKTVTRVMPVVGISTQLSSILASKILLQLFETLGKSWKSWKILHIWQKIRDHLYSFLSPIWEKNLYLLFGGCDKGREHCGLCLKFLHYEITISYSLW